MGGEVVGDRGSQERCRELTLSSTLIPSLTGKPPTSRDGSAISTARASVADSRSRRLAIRSNCGWTVGRQPLNEASAIEFVATFFLLPGCNITPQSSLHSTTFVGKIVYTYNRLRNVVYKNSEAIQRHTRPSAFLYIFFSTSSHSLPGLCRNQHWFL